MAEYHKYVFDQENRTLVGKFEEMYQAVTNNGFDSWHQDDLRQIDKGICLNILSQYNFNYILDVGCGKGMLTQFLKKKTIMFSALICLNQHCVWPELVFPTFNSKKRT